MPDQAVGNVTPASSASQLDRTLEQVMEENKRKVSEISELKAKIEQIEGEAEARLSELEAKVRLTPDEQDEQKKLLAKIAAIKANPESAPWLKVMEETATPAAVRAAAEAVFNYDFKQSLRTVERLAKMEGIEAKEFSNEINSILKGGRWQYDAQGNEVLPSERLELAYEEWKSQQALKNRVEQMNLPAHAETGAKRGITVSTAPTTKEQIESARQTGNFSEILAGKAARQAEIFK